MKMKNLFLTLLYMLNNNSRITIEDLCYKNAAKQEFVRFQENMQDSNKLFNFLLSKV